MNSALDATSCLPCLHLLLIVANKFSNCYVPRGLSTGLDLNRYYSLIPTLLTFGIPLR